MLITRISPVTGHVNEMDLNVTTEDLVHWESGALAQDAFPKLTADEREFIISGCTPDDWNKLFGEEE